MSDINTLKATINSLNGRFFTVDYLKKDGSENTINGRTGVIKYLKGGTRTNNNVEALIMYDLKKKGYRTVNLDTIKGIRCNNMIIPVFAK